MPVYSVHRAVRGAARGLSLVEMCLALAILGLVAASIAAAFIAASDAVEKGRERVELIQAGRAAMNRLLAELDTVTSIEARSDNYVRVYCEGAVWSGNVARRVEFWVDEGTLWRQVEGEEAHVLAEHVQGFETGGLTLWSTLGALSDILTPRVGPGGYFTGSPSWTVVHFADGYWSQADSGATITFPTAGVLDNARGTIEFWFRPDFSAEFPGLKEDKYLIDTADGGSKIQLFFDESGGELTYRVSGKELKWGATWAPRDVVHVAVVWDCTGRRIGEGRTLALYVDGVLRENDLKDATWDPEPFGPSFVLGKADRTAAEGAFENLRVYDYCKTGFRDRYLQGAPGLMRVRLDLVDDETSHTFTIESAVVAQ